MLDVEHFRPADLSQADTGLWRAMAADHPAFANPLLGPDFAQAVGAVRDDARVAVVRRQGRTLGFLPYHLRPGGLARAIGAPLSDYHALVSVRDAGLDGASVLTAAGLASFRYTGMVDPFGVFGGEPDKTAYVIALEDSADAYLERVRAANPKKIKNYRRLNHKLEREVGPVEMVAPDLSRAALDQLITWKREQLERTGSSDFLRPDWTRQLLIDLFERRDGDFQGLMINLYAGGELVAGHFGVRLGGVYHPWIASTNPAFAAWSPGQVFLLQAIAAMPGLGLGRYDLGPDHDHYKRSYGLTHTLISEGLATSPSAAGRMASSVESAWIMAGSRRPGPVGRLRRRLDAIASVELTMGGRVRGVIQAVASRTFSRDRGLDDA